MAKALLVRLNPSRRSVAGAVGLFVVMGTAGCRDEAWDAPDLRAPPRAVTRALGDTAFRQSEDGASRAPDINSPRSLRPCCAFGTDLGVELKGVAVPGFALANVVGPADLGPHRYDNGFISIDRKDRRGWIDNEKNGIVYTCRGGFIDVAHVRDNADLTLFLTAAISRGMDERFSISLPPQGAEIRVVGGPVDSDRLGRFGRRALSVEAAQWAAFQLSIWHEIATWYGFAALESWPEKVSAFSPEDLYSNLLGTKVAGGIIREGGANSGQEYERGMDVWIQRVLERLEALPQEGGRAATKFVDGAWWDSTKRLPDWDLVSRRYMALGPELEPWLISMASAKEGKAPPVAECVGETELLALRVPAGFEGRRFDDVLAVEFTVDEKLVANGFPLPNPNRPVVTQADFPAIVAAIREEMTERLGDDVDRP